MEIYHLNCGTLYPRFPPNTQSILYCLLVETNDGLLLVDTGFGIQDYRRPTRMIKLFTWSLGMNRVEEETAISQVEQMGFRRTDVKHIVMTHLHCDHSGGLRDFPEAQVHVHAQELEAIENPEGFKARFYESEHWAHGPSWVVHVMDEEVEWFGFPSMRVQEGLVPDIRLIPLHGHSRGHCGVAIETESGWLLHCGDATYPFYKSNNPRPPYKPLPFYVMSPPLWLERNLIGEHTPQLRELYQRHGDEIQMICSNDIITFSEQVELHSLP